VEWNLRNPNWWSGNISSRMLLLMSLEISNFSSIFEITDNRLIGRYDVTSCGGLPDFGTNIISPSLNCIGQYFQLRTALNSCTKALIPSLGSSVSTFPFIWSMPGAFFLFRFFICWYTSGSVKFLIGNDICRGESR